VGELAYELELPSHLKIHPVISVIHLEQAYDDEYGRTIPPPSPLIVDGREEHEIERIVEQKGTHCKVKWRYDDTETWEPIANLREDVPGLLSRFQQKQRQKRGKRRADVGEADPN
jgi:hypothetical protein